MAKSKVDSASLKILIPFKILGAFFWVIAALTVMAFFFFAFRFYFATALMYAVLAVVNGIMAYGLWKMQKWVVPLLGGSAIIVLAINLINVVKNTRTLGQALTAFAILAVIFIFSYFSRNFLEGEYDNRKVLGSFLTLLIFSQLIAFFLK
jgi:uncharacterized membrane protein (DUF2068 family)